MQYQVISIDDQVRRRVDLLSFLDLERLVKRRAALWLQPRFPEFSGDIFNGHFFACRTGTSALQLVIRQVLDVLLKIGNKLPVFLF